MPDDLPALGDAVKAFVWSWYNPGLFYKKKTQRMENKPRTLKSVKSVHMDSEAQSSSAAIGSWGCPRICWPPAVVGLRQDLGHVQMFKVS